MLKRELSLSSLGSDGNTSFLRAARAGHLDKVLEHLKSNIDINTSNANGLNALHLASKDGHVDVVAELLKRGAVVDAATKKGNTALHIASLAGQEEVVKLLVQHGASVNVQSQNGFTPLYMAAQENHDNVVKYLLANGANQSLATEDGFTPLAVAMQQGHDKVVTVLLENDTRGKVRLPALHIAAKKDDVKAAKLLLENEHNPDVTSKSGFTPLHIASHYGNESIANLLIHKGADVNYAAKHNITPLHVAAKWGKTNMVALLLEHGATIESKTRDGLTPLHCAARSGHEQVVDMLLERGAPISCKTKNGLAPLHMAAQGDHVDAARILLYHRAPVDEVTVDYLTALHVAAHCGHVRVAKLLLDRQADANARALNGFTPLHIACKKNRIKVVELLLKHGASIGATTESGLTPLHVASFMGCMNIVIYLLQHDANPDVPTVRGETPLHLAARANQTDIIRILLRNGAQVDARAREQQTPLHIASRLGNVDIVMLLLQHGAKVDTTTKDMYTALHIAAKEGQDEVVAVLIENGASLNATTKKGFTPLHLAAKYGNIKVAKLLLQKEAPVDAQGKNGVTPLHVASHYDHQNVALLLLDKGASPHATAKNGHTPLHIAARKNQMDIANTLLEYGANPNAESKAGFTPLHLSSQEGHTDMSSLLIEHEANTNYPAKNGLTPLHLCAQEDRVPVAEILVKNGAEVDASTKGGFTSLHIASHYGQTNMVKFLLANGANVGSTTSLGYTPLHQAAQQGHTNIVNILLENSAHPNAVTLHGQTPLHIAQKLGYISVIETLKVVTETTTTTTTMTMTIEEKYKVVAPEAMQETFMSDSEEEGGEDTVLGDHSYRYLTADEMKSLGDDSLPIDVTRDERIDSNKMVTNEEQNALPPQAIEDGISPQYITENYVEYTKKYTPDNVDLARHPINIGFLVSFLVDARGGAMRGCRHSGVRVIVPPRCAPSPTRITCRYVRPQRTPHPPPLMEGEALASRVLELGPVGAKFLGPVIIEVPHFAALRGKEREIVILRSDNGETWREHTVEASEDILNEVLNDSFEAEDLNQLEDVSSGRITRVLTHDFPQYFAIVTRIRQEVHAIGPEGGMVSSTVVPQVQAVFPQGALTKKIKVGLQAQPIDPELTAKLLGHGVAVSPVVTVEPRRRKFHKAITLSMPAPRAHSQGMINQYSGNAPTLRLLCSITGGTTRAQWEDVTGSTPLTFVNDCVSFTTTVSARFWLMDCRNIGDATKMATELYKEAIHVPFMAKFVVFAKRIDPLEARLRVFCMTDDKEDKTLEHQEHFTEVAKSRDVEVLEGKPQYIEFAGNLVPITKSGEPLQFSFRAFRENRLPFSVRVKDQHAEAVGRCLFMKEPKIAKGEPPQQPICILNIVLPDDIVTETVTLTDNETFKRHVFLKDNFEYYRPDPRLADMSNLLGEDWISLAEQLGLTPSEINVIKSEYPDSVAKQAQSMLRMWISQSGNKAQGDALENALMRIGREDIIPQCLNVDDVDRIPRIPKDVMQRYQKDIDTVLQTTPAKQQETYESKYSAEEKVVEEPSDDEDFNKSVSERRQQIEKRLTDHTIPASAQRQEITEEITSIKRQSIVEDKIAEAEVKHKPEQTKTTTIIKTVTTDIPETKTVAETVETIKTTTTDYQPNEVTVTKQFMENEKPDRKTTVRTIITETRTTEHIPSNEIPFYLDRRDSDLLEGVTQRLETTKKVTPRVSAIDDPNSPKLSKTPPPSPADFIFKERASAIQEWSAPHEQSKDKPPSTVADQGAAMQGIPTSTTKHLASSEELSLDSPKLEKTIANDNNLDALAQKTNAFIDAESRRKSDIELETVSRELRIIRQGEKIKTLSRDSSREDTSRGDEKKSKKSFFGTLKSIVSKSQDRSDSESEKPQKKEKKKERRKKKKQKLPHEKLPLEPPERPLRKPKLPTPPPTERPEFENIPYVEASPTDQPNGVSEIHDVQVTDLDAMNEIPEHIKLAANDLVFDLITTGETKAQTILEKGSSGKQVIIGEEIKKTIEPKIYDTGEFRIVVSPTAEHKVKDYFKVDTENKKIEKKISEAPDKTLTHVAEIPVRPQRRKEHIYEDIGESVVTQPPMKLILYDARPIPDIKEQTTNLIQNEINFAGWADDGHNVYKSSDIKDKEHTLPKTGKKHGKLFGFLSKKSSKDVDESDNERESNREIIEKQDRESSKERTIKADNLLDEEGVDQKKGGFFGIFVKKSKKEDDHKDDKEMIDKKEPEVRPITALSEAEIEKSLDTKTEAIFIGVKETATKEHVKPTERVDGSPEHKLKDKKKPKKEKISSESEDENEHKKGGLFGFFGKKGRKDDKEETVKAIQISELVRKDMSDTSIFLKNEIKYFEDVKLVLPKLTEDKSTLTLIETKKPEVIITGITSKPEEAETENLLETPSQEKEKIPTKTKRKKQRHEKRESSVSEDESEGKKSGIFGLFGKKHKKGKTREKTPKISDEIKLSEEVHKQIIDTASFLQKEIELFDDTRQLNGHVSNSASDEPTIRKEQVRLEDVKKALPQEIISMDSKTEHVVIKEAGKLDSVMKENILKPEAEIIRETVSALSIIEEPLVERQTKTLKDIQEQRKPIVPVLPTKESCTVIIEETVVDSVDGKPIKQVQRMFEETRLKKADDQAALNIATTLNFLQDEIEYFDDVKPISKEQLIIKDDIQTKDTKESKKKTITETVPRTVKKKDRKDKDDAVSDDDSESYKKRVFFGLFDKKTKKDGDRTKKEDEKIPKETKLSEKVMQNMAMCAQFLTNEVLNFEDVKPIKVVKERHEAIVLEKPISKTEMQKFEKIKPSFDEAKKLDERFAIDITQAKDFLQNEIKHFDDVKLTIKEISVIKESVEVETKAPSQDEKKKDEKKTNKIETESHEKLEKGKKGRFYDIFGKKSKKDDSKIKLKEDDSTLKEIQLSEETLRNIENSMRFLDNEVSNFYDVKPVIENIEEKFEKTFIENPSLKTNVLIPEKPQTILDSTQKLPKQAIIQATDFLKEEIEHFDDVKTTPKGEVPKGVKPDDTKKHATDNLSPKISKTDTVIKKEEIEAGDKKKSKKEKTGADEPESQQKGGFFRLFVKKPKKDENEPEELKFSEEAFESIVNCDQFLANEITLFEDVRPLIKKEVYEAPSIKTQIKKFESKTEELTKEGDGARTKIAETAHFLNDEIEKFDDVKQILPKSLKKAEWPKSKVTQIIETIIVKGDLPEEDRKILDDSDQIIEHLIVKQHTTLDGEKKSKEESSINTEAQREQKKGGSFEIFSKRTTKDEKQLEESKTSEEALKNIAHCDQFLTNEIIYFEDVRPVVKKDTSEALFVKCEIKKPETKTGKPVDHSEDSKIKIVQTVAFLKDEIEKFYDVKQIVPEISEKIKMPELQAKHIAKDTNIVRPDLAIEESTTIIEDDQVKEDLIGKQHIIFDDKKKPKEPKASAEEQQKQKKGGLFALFGKKTKKDEKLSKETEASEAALKNMIDCDEFLTTEVTHFEDVRPVVKKEVTEAPFAKCEIKKPEIKAEKSRDHSEDMKINATQTANFLKNEIQMFDDVKQIVPETSEKSKLQATLITKDTSIVNDDTPIEETIKILDDGDQVKEDLVGKQHIILDDKKKPKELKTSAEEQRKQKKGGLFGLFGRKIKKDEKLSKTKISEATLKNMIDCGEFLTTEITHFEDVRPIVEKELSKTPVAKCKIKESEIETEKSKNYSEDIKIKIIQTADFLKHEIERFHDVKQIVPEELETVKKLKPQAADITKDASNVNADVSAEESTKILEDSDRIREDVTGKQHIILDDKKKTKELKTSVEEHQKQKKGSLFGLFGKKTKKDEKLSKETETSEVTLKTMIDCDEFLTTEITHFEDVRPIVKKEITEVPFAKCEIKKQEVETEESRDHSEDTKTKITQTADFLKDEIERFDDVKQIVPEAPEKVMKPKPEAIRIIKETIIVRGDLPDQVIKKILEENDPIKEATMVKEYITLDENKKPKEKCKATVEEAEDQKKGGFFGVFSKKAKKDEGRLKELEKRITSKEIKLSQEVLQQLTKCDKFLKDEVKYFEDVRPIIKPKPLEIPFTETSEVVVNERKTSEESQKIKQTASEEYVRNVAMTTNFLADEIKYFNDVKSIVKDATSKKVEQMEASPKKIKKRKKGKRESSESGDDSDGSKKSGLFKLFGKKGKKEKPESKGDKTDITDESKTITPELIKVATAEEKPKAERKTSQKKSKRDKSEDDTSKPLFGIFGKKEKVPVEVPAEPREIIISEVTLKNMKDSSDFLINETERFDDVKELKQKIIKSDVNLDGKITIAESTKILEPKVYQIGELQMVVSTADEQKEREFFINNTDKTNKSEKEVLSPIEQIITTATTTTAITTVITTTSKIPISPQQKFFVENIPPVVTEAPSTSIDKDKMPTIMTKIITVKDKSLTEVHLSQEVIKNMINTRNFLNHEISRFHDVRPIACEQEKVPLSDGEDQKDKKKRKKKQHRKSIEDGSSRKSGFFGLFGKKEKKSESFESAEDTKKPEEQISQKDEIVKESIVQYDIEEKALKNDTLVTVPLDFVESVHLTNNFLNDEIKNYHDVKPVFRITEVPLAESENIKSGLTQKESEPKVKSKSRFGLFGKKSEDHPDEQQPQKEITIKEKRERRKSGSPFRLFTKKSKDEEKIEQIKPIISEQALQDMYETKNFLSTEIMRYNDVPYKLEDKQLTEIKKSVVFVDTPTAIASTTTIVKESEENAKIKIDTVLKEIKEDLQPTEKVIVVIKDDVSEGAKTIKQMKLSPNIMSQITSCIPSDSQIKEIRIETIEMDDETMIPEDLIQPPLDKIVKDLKKKDVKSIADTVKSMDEGTCKLEGFLKSKEQSQDYKMKDATPKVGEISQIVQSEIDNITRELKDMSEQQVIQDTATSETQKVIQEVPLLAEEFADEITEVKTETTDVQDVSTNSKAEVKKTTKKSGGFFSKLGDRLSGKTKDIKDDEKLLAGKIDDKLKEVESSITKTETKIDELQQISSKAIGITEKTISDKQNKVKEIMDDRIQKLDEKILEEKTKLKEGIVQVKDISTEMKDNISRGISESNRKTEEIDEDVRKTTAEIKTETVGYAASKIIDVRGEADTYFTAEDISNTQVQDAITEKLACTEIPVFEEKLAKECTTKSEQDIITNVKHKLDPFKNQTLDIIEETTKSITEEITQPEVQLEEEIPKPAKEKENVKGKARKKSGGFFSKLGGIFTDKSDDVTKAQEIIKIKEDEINKSDKSSGLETMSDSVKDKIESFKEADQILSQKVKENTDEIEGFSANLSMTGVGIKDDASDTMKSVAATIADKTNQSTKSIEKTTTDLAKQTNDFFTEVQDKEMDATEYAIVKIKEEISNVCDKSSDSLTIISEEAKKKEDARKTIKEGTCKIEEPFTDLDKKTKDVKVNISDKMENVEVIVADTTNQIKESTEEIATDLVKQTDEALIDLKHKTVGITESTIYKIKENVDKKIEESNDVLASVPEVTKETVESFKQEGETLSQDLNESVKEGKGKIERFFSDLGKETKDVKNDVSDKIKEIDATSAETKKQTIESMGKITTDITKQTDKFLTPLEHKVTNIAKDTSYEIKEEGRKVSEIVSKTSEDNAALLEQSSKALSQHLKENVVESKGTVGGLFIDLGDMFVKTTDDFEAVTDTTKQATELLGKTTTDIVKQTDKTLTDLKDKATGKNTTAEIKEEEIKMAEKSSDPLGSISKTTAEKMKQTSEALCKDFKGSGKETDKLGRLIGSLDKKDDVKDDASSKIKNIAAVMVDTTKETTESIEKTTIDPSKETDERLDDSRGKATNVVQDTTDKIKKEKSKITEKDGSDTFATVSKIIKEKSESCKETSKALPANFKESTDKIKELFSDLGEKIEDFKRDTSGKIKNVDAVMTDAKKQTTELDLVKQTDCVTKDMQDKIIKEKNETVSEAPKENLKSLTQVSETKVEDVKQSKFEEGLSELGKEIKDIEGGMSDKIKSIAEIMADSKTQTTQCIKETTPDLAKQTSDFLTITQDKVTDVAKKITDKIMEEGSKETKEVEGKIIKGTDCFTVSSPDDNTTIQDEKMKSAEKTKGIKGNIKEDNEAAGGLFNIPYKKKGKKTKDIESKHSRADDKSSEMSNSKDLTSTKDNIERTIYDTDKFLLEERIKLTEESSVTPEKTEYKKKLKSPLVTSPTLPRRVASHRIVRGDLPYFVEVTNLAYEDSSSDESYVVTEPTERYSARISDDSSTGSQHKRKPLFHIESEEDSFDTSHRGSIKSNILENLSAHRLETLVTDLDDIDDIVPTDTHFTSNVLFEANKDVKSTSQLETEIIEQKLSDIEKALGTLEQAETKESVITEKPSLKRVERKFERMASELMAEGAAAVKDSNLTTPEMEEKHEQDFRKIVSQLSTEEVSECQREYAALWDEQTFSPSDEGDTTKTPDSQADILELPQGEASGIQQWPEQQSTPQTFARAEAEETTSQRKTSDQDRPVADQHMLSEEMKKLLKELEDESKK